MTIIDQSNKCHDRGVKIQDPIHEKSENFKSKRRVFCYNITKKKVFFLKNHYNKSKSFKLKAGTYYLNTVAYSDDGIDVFYHYDFTIKG